MCQSVSQRGGTILDSESNGREKDAGHRGQAQGNRGSGNILFLSSSFRQILLHIWKNCGFSLSPQVLFPGVTLLDKKKDF